jgi:ubiquinone/menaquinone biosynthesis C-methylase UbiE
MSEEFWWRHCGFFYNSARRCHLVQNVHRAFFRHVDSLGLPPGIKAFDAGCGSGSSTFPLAHRGLDVLAVDFGESVLRQAIKENESRHHCTNLRFELMDLSRPLPLPDSSVDLVTSLHCIMKIPNVDDTLAEFFRILKPGGHAVISTTPDNYTIVQWLKRYAAGRGWLRTAWDIRWLAAWAVPYFVFTRRSERRGEHRWDENHFARHLEKAGFVTRVIERVPYINVGCVVGVFSKPGGKGDRLAVG